MPTPPVTRLTKGAFKPDAHEAVIDDVTARRAIDDFLVQQPPQRRLHHAGRRQVVMTDEAASRGLVNDSLACDGLEQVELVG